MMPIIVQAEPSPLPPPVQLDAVEVFGRRGAARVAPEQVLGRTRSTRSGPMISAK